MSCPSAGETTVKGAGTLLILGILLIIGLVQATFDWGR